MDKKEKILDKDAIKLLLQSLTPEEMKLFRENYSIKNKDGKKRKISIHRID